MTASQREPFLTAEWRYLAMLNFPIEREVLAPWVPAGTAVDTYQGQAYVSLVGFLFQDVRVNGWAVPFHRNFEEVNLRFYVRRFSGDDWRRGVVFLKELVPHRAVAAVARWCYNENYQALPMRHRLDLATDGSPARVEYSWRFERRWHSLRLATRGPRVAVRPGSLEEFITEHYWGYARQQPAGCLEYEVEHPRWPIWHAAEAGWEGDATGLYGPEFAAALARPPASAFLAEGSPVTVYRGNPVTAS